MIFKLFASFVLTCLIFVGCLGLKPNPQYVSTNGSKTNRSSKNVDVKRLVAVSSYEARYLINQIENYMGVPYRWGGTTSAGMDCSGFVKTVLESSIDIDLPHNSRQLFGYGRKVEPDSLAFGDLVFFKNIGARGISHVGIYLSDSRFVHASTKRGVIVSSINAQYYKTRYVGAKRIYRF